MKKLLIAALAAATIAMAVPSTVHAREAGGCVGGIIGCCFGIRAAGDYNEGKDLHLMEWGRLIPIFGIYVEICNFLDGYNGLTTKDLQTKYGATYF